ncbi:MAG TPA: hypothetical protein VIH27_01270 [Nitrososphaerales archaeon]
MDKDPKLVEEWINYINEHGVNLTKWELDFMESITEQFELYRRLSDKQVDIVERIYTDKTP